MKTCKNCGAPLKSGTCEYCGTVYAEKTSLPFRPFMTKAECLAEVYKAEVRLAEIDRRRRFVMIVLCLSAITFIAMNVLFFAYWCDIDYSNVEQCEIVQTYEIRGVDE